jgi:hypothetical protein
MIEQVPIKVILIVLLVAALRALLVQKSLITTSRVLAVGTFALLAFLVIFPKITTVVAGKLGVGRGVDLLFYLSHAFLLLLIIGLWRRTVTLTMDLTKLAREIALEKAAEPKG